MKLNFVCVATWLLLASITAKAADLRGISPATDSILLLHFDEGHIDHGLSEKDSKPYITKLDTAAAALVANYRISSEDDARYKTAQAPLKVGRKSRAADTRSMYSKEKFVLDHLVYLVLPQPLQRGCTYTVRTSGLAPTPQAHTFLFHEYSLRSETLHVNQIGFTPDAPKFAYLSHWMGDLGGANLDSYTDRGFHVARVSTNEVVFSGKVAKRKDTKTGTPQTTTAIDGTPWNGAKKAATPKNFTEADVFECDFSGCKTAGRYRVVVEGLGCSFPFAIDDDVYRSAYRMASRGLFFQRSGVEKEVEPGVVYPRGHHPDDGLNAFQYDKNWRFIDHPQHNFKITPTGTLKLWGWYRDAGDWDGYPAHVNVTLNLLLLYELAPEKFADGQVGNRLKSNSDGKVIDEGKNGIPDLLDEAAWLVQFYRRARTIGLQTGVTTGGVPGGYSGVDSCGPEPSWKDKRPLHFSAEDPATTYQYAACAAWLASCLDKAAKGAHPESAEWLKEARAAYAWAKANTKDGDDQKISNQRMLASLCLYRLTPEKEFHAQFAADIRKDGALQRAEVGWYAPNWWEFAAGIYALLPADKPELDAELQKLMRTKVIEAVERAYIKTAKERGYRFGFEWMKAHQLGTLSTPMLAPAALAYRISGEKKYLDVMHTTASYFLGGNPLNMVWMTGLGQRSVKYPFHPDSWSLFDYNSMVYENEILPGMVPYGSCESVDFFGPGFVFTGDEDFSRTSAYPDVETWPLSEVRFENRYSISGGEFTIVQDIAPSIFAYGFLCGDAKAAAPESVPRPGVTLLSPQEKALLKAGGDVALRVKTTPGVQRVEYYYNQHFIGESNTQPFALTWHNAPAGEWLISAKAFDDAGRISKPNDPAFKVDARIRVDATMVLVAPDKLEVLNVPSQPLALNAVWQLSASFTPITATSQGVTWTSSDPSIATVNSQGVVLAKASGKATITVKSKEGGLSSVCQIQVRR